ncbi:MAG: FKBP-type peptidyl-prolyl cis-trans isomerase [Nocardioidaceae bacterium]|nr:FKBP-type peptidyl-prolyl cis-trans isomerase [Nocardioidaceae bacterium]MCL2613363.1 FKBP-type peptidyl-prolyl cis-trans isomerase [Nocardioidaceae bacterium]
MPTRLRRAAVPLLVSALALTLTACGGSSSTASGFDAVSISGSFGQAPKFDWKKQMDAGSAQTKTLISGNGPTLADGDTALVNIAVGDGWTKQTPITTFGSSKGAVAVPVGGSAGQPQALGDLFATFLQKYVAAGTKVGTRIAIAVNTDKAFPQYATAFANAHIDIGNQDGLVIVADIAATVPKSQESEKAPSGPAAKPAGWAPKVVTKSGAPTKLDFKGTPKPSGELQTTTLVKGSGPALPDGSTAVVKYLGEVYGGTKPFDENFSKSSVLNVLIGKKVQPFQGYQSGGPGAVDPVIPGWSQGLIGAHVGSRVLVQIPPKMGYGSKPPTGIPANSTLYFVVDVLGGA